MGCKKEFISVDKDGKEVETAEAETTEESNVSDDDNEKLKTIIENKLKKLNENKIKNANKMIKKHHHKKKINY